MKHIMIDLETLGTTPGCIVLSIGAVAFDPRTGELGNEWYQKLNWKNSLLRIETATLHWWMQQDPKAREEAFSGDVETVNAGMAFMSFWQNEGAEFLWCHGATFDAPVWQAAVGVVPWRYNSVRDTRTIYDAAQVSPDRTVGLHHHALDDARNQAVAVLKAYEKLGLGPETGW